VHLALTNEVNSLSNEEVHFRETCCRILGKEYQDKAQQIGGEAVEAGRGDPVKTNHANRAFWETGSRV
jgi:hypothetical protein